MKRLTIYLLPLLLMNCESIDKKTDKLYAKYSETSKSSTLANKKSENEINSDNSKYIPVTVDYDSIPLNKKEPYGKPLLTPKTGYSSGNSVAFSPDGKYILMDDRLWDINGNKIRDFKGHSGNITSVAFSPNGKYILTGSRDNTAILWDINGNQIQTFKGHSKEVQSVAFSPDGKHILTGSHDETAKLWDLNGNQIQTFKGHSSFVYSVAFFPNGKGILTGSWDRTAKLWDLNGGVIQTIEHSHYVSSVAFSPNGKSILTGSYDKDGTVILWDLDGNQIQTFKGHSGHIRSLTFSPDGMYILTGSDDGTAKLWDLNGTLIHNFRDKWVIFSVAFSPNGKTILTSSSDTNLWDLKGNLIQSFASHSRLESVTFSLDGRYILASSNDWGGIGMLWDTYGGDVRFTSTFNFGQFALVNSIAISPDGRYILTGSWANSLARLWDLNGNLIKSFREHYKSSIDLLLFSPDGKYILVISGNKLELWDPNGSLIRTFKDNVEKAVVFSPDGKYVLTGSNQTAILWDINGNQIQTFKGHSEQVYSLAFSRDGKHILTGSYDKTAKLWNLKGKEVRTFPNSGHVNSVAFSSDGRSILIGSDQNAILWNINGKLIRNFNEHFEEVKSVTFSPDGKYILINNDEGVARISSLDGERWITLTADNLIFSNDGRFDSSLGELSAHRVNFRKGGTNELISPDSLFDQFYTPGLLSLFFNEKGEQKKPEKSLEDLIKSPLPQVTINSKSVISESTASSATITVTACDIGGGAEDIRLYHNNSLVDLQTTKGMEIIYSGKCQTKAFSVALFPGENSFRGSAKNRTNLWGFSDYFKLNWKPKEIKKPTQHLVTIGVNKYSGKLFASLQYAVPDAKLFKESLLAKSQNLYEKTESYELLNERATREGIRSLLADVANKVKPENGDVLILFFSGHGVNVDSQYYFIPAKYTGNASKESLEDGALTQKMLVDLLSAIHAKNKLVILDSCQSGGDEWSRNIGRFSHSTGVGVIAAAQSIQSALESSEYSQGLLTVAITDEIKNGQRENGKLYLTSLAGRVIRKVKQLALKHKYEQVPYTMIINDFELVE